MEFLLYLLLGACAGVLAGLFGVGGGIIIVPVLVFSFTLQGFDPQVLTHLAVGTSLATIIFTSVNAVREHHRRGAGSEEGRVGAEGRGRGARGDSRKDKAEVE